jgi:hypothetical protein
VRVDHGGAHVGVSQQLLDCAYVVAHFCYAWFMNTIRPRERLSRLKAIAAHYSVTLEAIIVVPSIKAWCEEHDVPETNHWRTGITIQNGATHAPLILLAEEITPSMQSSVCSALEFHGYRVEQLNDSSLFLTHLFLHELAHAQFPNATEQQCDDWAFAELAQNAA